MEFIILAVIFVTGLILGAYIGFNLGFDHASLIYKQSFKRCLAVLDDVSKMQVYSILASEKQESKK